MITMANNSMQLVNNDHPLLHKPSQPVMAEQLENRGERLKPIASVLIKTMKEKDAYGISACQLGIDLSLFCMEVEGRMRVCANPQIVAASLDMERQEEGCLSFPGLRLAITRPDAVAVRYHDIDGNEVLEQLEGLEARVWLHEYDHTQGICFTDRASRLALQMARKKLAKRLKRNQR